MAETGQTERPGGAAAGPDWRKRMSDTVAHALLVYTALQILVTMGALQEGVHSLLPFVGLVVLVAAIIPACRMLEARWNRLGAVRGADPALAGAYRRDRLRIWAVAIVLPFALTGTFKVLAAYFAA